MFHDLSKDISDKWKQVVQVGLWICVIGFIFCADNFSFAT